MKKIFIIIFILLVVLGLLLYIIIFNHKNTFEKNLKGYIDDELWNDMNSYDAGHTLLVPMFYAYQSNDINKIVMYDDLFARFANYLKDNNYKYEYWNLNHMQFIFLVSNYINLTAKTGRNSVIKNELLNYLFDETFYYTLLKREIYNTTSNPQYSSIISANRRLDEHTLIGDQTLYHLAIICNLKEYCNLTGYHISEKRIESINNTIDLINRIFKDRVTYLEDGKWLFEVGFFDNSEDYAYMNYEKIEENMVPSENKNTTWDSSHFMRLPIFLQIFKRANSDNTDMYNYYENLIKGLEKQFLENVLVSQDDDNNYYRTKNYMDGRNGLYRYNYNTQKSTAYLPYQLSGSLCLGWWSFLGGRLNSIYTNIYNTFPLNEQALKTYVGPNTTRERNSFVKWPDFFENGFAKHICLYASKLRVEEVF